MYFPHFLLCDRKLRAETTSSGRLKPTPADRDKAIGKDIKRRDRRQIPDKIKPGENTPGRQKM